MSSQFYSNSPSSVDSWFECFPCGFALDCRLIRSVTVLDSSYALLIKLEYVNSLLIEFLLKGCYGMSYRVCGVLFVHLELLNSYSRTPDRGTRIEFLSTEFV